MSKFSHDEARDIVKKAMELTAAVEYGEDQLEDLNRQRWTEKPPAAPFRPHPPERPAKPARLRGQVLEVPKVNVNYPPRPECNMTFGEYFQENLVVNVILCLGLATIALPYIYYQYYKTKKEKTAQMQKAPEYLAAVEAAERFAIAEQERVAREVANKQYKLDQELILRQRDIDEEYAKALHTYENVTLVEFRNGPLKEYEEVTVPNHRKALDEYEERREAWYSAHESKIAMTQDLIEFNKSTLEELYNNTMLISLRYRKLTILQWLYNELLTSDITYERAVDLFDNFARDTKIENFRLSYEQRSDAKIRVIENASSGLIDSLSNLYSGLDNGFSSIYSAIDEGNEIAAKTRRDGMISAGIGIYQTHKTNKFLKKQTKLMEDR